MEMNNSTHPSRIHVKPFRIFRAPIVDDVGENRKKSKKGLRDYRTLFRSFLHFAPDKKPLEK